MKCIVEGCTHYSDKIEFKGDLCIHCHRMLTTGVIGYGNTFIHKLRNKFDSWKRVFGNLNDPKKDPDQ